MTQEVELGLRRSTKVDLQKTVQGEVWKFFANSCGVSLRLEGWRRMLGEWWRVRPRSSVHKSFLRAIPAFICWHLWKWRNKVIHENARLPVSRLIDQLCSDIQDVMLVYARIPHMLNWGSLVSYVESWRRPLRAKIVRWLLPPSSRMKLNVDGCSKGVSKESGGGGLVRDELGEVVVGFYAYFGEATSLEAEARAMECGLALCRERGFRDVLVETDSVLLCNVINGASPCPWSIQSIVNRIQLMRPIFGVITHIYREANKPADALANF